MGLKMGQIDNNVIPGGFCIGCGACTYFDPDAYRIEMDQFGKLQALKNPGAIPGPDTDRVCPFSDASLNEDQLAEVLYPNSQVAPHLGRYIDCFVGHVKRSPFRELGSSGGFGKWILWKLLDEGHVDAVIQVAYSDKPGRMYDFKVCETADAVLDGAKSAYYPVTMDEVLNHIRDNPARYAITAVPCFARAIRNLAAVDSSIGNGVVFVVGIICGHLKSTAFAESLSWQLGIPPNALKSIDFRGKIKGKKANEKGVTATAEDRISTMRSSRELFGGDWGWGFFKYKACDFCDDVVAETADVSIGDAWLPEYMNDSEGTSVLILRDERIAEVIRNGLEEGELNIVPISPDRVLESQAGGIRHRWEGLALRLKDMERAGAWAPKKRVVANDAIPFRRRNIYRMRRIISEVSHYAFVEAKNAQDIEIFYKQMRPLVRRLDGWPVYLRPLGYIEKALRKLSIVWAKRTGRGP